MNVFSQFRQVVLEGIATLVTQDVLPDNLDTSRVTCEPPKDTSHGDIATNAAMVLAKAAKVNPRQIAEQLVQILQQNTYISTCDVAGPGFVNLTLNEGYWRDELKEGLQEGLAYGDSTMGGGKRVNVEYVSVNPTGPMHIGHSRVAIVGDVLVSLLKKAGYDVTKEFYINDAGAQTIALAQSVYQRYLEALGHPIDEIGTYPADYLIPVGKALADKYGEEWVDAGEDQWLPVFRAFAIDQMMDLIRKDLDLLKIHHDVFRSEQAVIDEGGLEKSFAELDQKDLIYIGQLPKPKGKVIDDWEPRDLTLFRTSQFGDNQDRPLKKSDGSWTYIMGDIAYHRDKILRGFDIIIDVLGLDHVGYVKRVKAAVSALSDEKVEIDVSLCALVKFIDRGEVIKMSKRAGTFIPVDEVIERIGVDATRFMMMTRKNDIPLDFDFAKVVEQSKDNPVYYVQYAHARTCSISRHVATTFPGLNLESNEVSKANLNVLTAPEDIAMIKILAQWPRQVEIAAQAREPHRLAYFLFDVAAAFHGLWTKGKDDAELRFIYPDDEEKTYAKYALVLAARNVIASGLNVFGVQPVEEM